MEPLKLVLLPGMDGTGSLFTPLLGHLSSRVTPVVARYSGQATCSYAELRDQVRPLLPEEPFVLVGESFSGPLALELAAAHPPGLRAVVLVASFARCPWPSLAWLAPLLRPWLFARPSRWVVRHLLLDSNAPDELQEQVLAAVGSVSPRVLAARARAILGVNARAALARCRAPLYYLRAEGDRLVPARVARTMRGLRPDLVELTFPGPHLLLQRHPARLARVLEGLIALPAIR